MSKFKLRKLKCIKHNNILHGLVSYLDTVTIKLINLSWLAVSLPHRLSSYGQYVIMLTTMFVTLVKVRKGQCENRKTITGLRKATCTKLLPL